MICISWWLMMRRCRALSFSASSRSAVIRVRPSWSYQAFFSRDFTWSYSHIVRCEISGICSWGFGGNPQGRHQPRPVWREDARHERHWILGEGLAAPCSILIVSLFAHDVSLACGRPNISIRRASCHQYHFLFFPFPRCQGLKCFITQWSRPLMSCSWYISASTWAPLISWQSQFDKKRLRIYGGQFGESAATLSCGSAMTKSRVRFLSVPNFVLLRFLSLYICRWEGRVA